MELDTGAEAPPPDAVHHHLDILDAAHHHLDILDAVHHHLDVEVPEMRALFVTL